VQLRREAEGREVAYTARQLSKAHFLWRSSVEVAGTIVERYLRVSRGYTGMVPPTLRFLPARKVEHHPAMIAMFGVVPETEPGALGPLSTSLIKGVHLTLLQPDGLRKAETKPNKIIVGRSTGTPIVLAPPNDLLGLIVTEGIEDALSMHEATGLGAWAAGAAGRMPALAPALPAYLDTITVVADADCAGRKNTHALATALQRRGIGVEILEFSTEREIAP
jgi:hypothetical protein